MASLIASTFDFLQAVDTLISDKLSLFSLPNRQIALPVFNVTLSIYAQKFFLKQQFLFESNLDARIANISIFSN